MSDMDILSKGADKNANKKIDSEISLSDNIKQKIKAVNHDYGLLISSITIIPVILLNIF